MDKQERKRIRHELRLNQRAEERAAFPLSVQNLQSMFEAVDEALEHSPCDHSRRHTKQWLLKHGHDVDRVLEWLSMVGGFCDCEVILNAAGHVEDALEDQ